MRRIARTIKQALVYETFYVFEGDVNKPKPEVIPELEVEFREATPDDVPRFLDYSGNLVSRLQGDKFLSRMSRGDRCTIGIHNGEIISYHWIRTDNCLMDRSWDGPIQLGPGYAFKFGDYVVSPFRGKGIQQTHLIYDQSYLKCLGIHTTRGYVNSKNLVNLHITQKREYQLLGKFQRLTILGGWRLTSRSLSPVQMSDSHDSTEDSNLPP